MAEKINCDLRCDTCPHGNEWGSIALLIEERLSIVDTGVAVATEIAAESLSKPMPESLEGLPTYGRFTKLGHVTADFAVGVGVLRLELDQTLAQISETDCAATKSCRLGPTIDAAGNYADEVQKLVATTAQDLKQLGNEG